MMPSLPSTAALSTSRRSLLRARVTGALLACSLLAAVAPPASAQFLNGVYSRDGVDVIAVADSGALYRSVSGGVQWIRYGLGDKALRDVIARDLGVVVVGDSGKIYRSTDLGGTWTVAAVEGAPSLRRLESLGGDGLMAVGGGGTVLVSSDWGATWSPQASGTTEQLNAVRFVDGQNGWIAGTNGVGYQSYVPGFAVRNIRANIGVCDLATAENVLGDPARECDLPAPKRPELIEEDPRVHRCYWSRYSESP